MTLCNAGAVITDSDTDQVLRFLLAKETKLALPENGDRCVRKVWRLDDDVDYEVVWQSVSSAPRDDLR